MACVAQVRVRLFILGYESGDESEDSLCLCSLSLSCQHLPGSLWGSGLWGPLQSLARSDSLTSKGYSLGRTFEKVWSWVRTVGEVLVASKLTTFMFFWLVFSLRSESHPSYHCDPQTRGRHFWGESLLGQEKGCLLMQWFSAFCFKTSTFPNTPLFGNY